jgi:hypothetical protein
MMVAGRGRSMRVRAGSRTGKPSPLTVSVANFQDQFVNKPLE